MVARHILSKDLLFLQLSLMSQSIDVFSSGGRQTAPQEFSSSDRILSQEFYKSVYRDMDKAMGADSTNVGGQTPWDIGSYRPQPAVVRAYDEGKLRGHILDAGCGIGENCAYLAQKYGVWSVTGFDLSEDAVKVASEISKNQDITPFWTEPRFFAASCTEVADTLGSDLLAGLIGENDCKGQDAPLFDVVLDSGLLHCLSKEDARQYVQQIGKLLRPNTGRFYIGCFSTANPDPWDNPRRISEDYLKNDLFTCRETWDVISCLECWWARPPSRGSSSGGAFSLALWVEVRFLDSTLGESDREKTKVVNS